MRDFLGGIDTYKSVMPRFKFNGCYSFLIFGESDHKAELFKEITVKVISEYGEGVFFKHEGTSDTIYEINSSEFDLKTITLVNVDGYTLDDIWYEFDTGYSDTQVDDTNFDNGIIKFLEEKFIVQISVHLETETTEYSDSIRIRYVQN